MAKNKTYTGSRQSVGNPTLRKDEYIRLIKMIRKESEKIAKVKATGCSVSKDAPSA